MQLTAFFVIYIDERESDVSFYLYLDLLVLADIWS